MNPPEYLRLQLRLEGKEIFNGDRLRQVEIVPGEDMPLMIIAQFADDKIVAYYDEALQSDLYRELAKRICDINFPRIDSLLDVLKVRNISFEIGHYKTYLFSTHLAELITHDVCCISRQDPLIQAFGFGDFAERVYVVERDGKIASACVSVRENCRCAEAWVYTDPNYRKQGFAQQAVGIWAGQMIKAAKIPFYSHAVENTASANLARRLELQPIFEEICISYMNV